MAEIRGGPALLLSLSVPLSLVPILLLFPAFFAPPPLLPAGLGPPAWHPVLAAGVPLVGGSGVVLLLSSAAYLSAARGSALCLYFVRHCSYYLALAGMAYVAADAAHFVRRGGAGADASERMVRTAAAAILASSALSALCALEGGACRRVRRVARGEASRPPARGGRGARPEADAGGDDGASSGAPLGGGEARPAMPPRRARLRRRLFASAIGLYQISAALFVARTVSDFVIRDLDRVISEREAAAGVPGAAGAGPVRGLRPVEGARRPPDPVDVGPRGSVVVPPSEIPPAPAGAERPVGASLWRPAEGWRRAEPTAPARGASADPAADAHRRPPALAARDVVRRRGLQSAAAFLPLASFQLDLQGGALLLSLLESVGAFAHLAFSLALFSAAALYPAHADSVIAVALAASLRLALALGYAVNICLDGPVDNVDADWSAFLTAAELTCAALVLAGCAVGASDSASRRRWGAALRHVDEDPHARGSTRAASSTARRCATLLRIAAAPRHLYVRRKRRYAGALHLSSLTALAVATAQCVLLLSYDTTVYHSHHLLEMLKFSFTVCLLYAFVNYMSLSDGGAYYDKARLAIVALSLGGAILSSWQLAALVSGCSSRGMTTADVFVLALLSLGLAASLASACAAAALTDVAEDRVPGADLTLNVDARKADGELALQGEIAKANVRRRRTRALLIYVYLPSVLAYAMCVAVRGGGGLVGVGGDGGGGGGAAAAPYPLINRNVPPPPPLLRGGGPPVGRLLGSRGRVSPVLFLLVPNDPALPLLLHHGLLLILLAGDAVRARPSLSFGLLTARLVSGHACAVLTAFLGALVDTHLESEEAYATDERAEMALMLTWFAAATALAASLHRLWRGRRRAAMVADSITPLVREPPLAAKV